MFDNICLCGMEGGKMSYQETNKNEVVYMFTAWLEKVLYTAKLLYFRKLKYEITIVSIDSVPEEFLKYEEIDNNTLFRNETLEDAFMSLSKLRKKVLYLYFVEELSYKEIALELNMDVRNVRKLKERGISDLRKAFTGEINYD